MESAVKHTLLRPQHFLDLRGKKTKTIIVNLYLRGPFFVFFQGIMYLGEEFLQIRL